MSKKILLIGGGGHCHSVLDSIRSGYLYDAIGVVAKDKANYEELRHDVIISPYLVGRSARIIYEWVGGCICDIRKYR